MRIRYLAGLLALLLGACTTPQEKAAALQADMDRMMQVYGPACTRLGYTGNSDPWRSCVLELSAKDDVRRYGYPRFHAGFGHRRWAYDGYWGPYW